MRSRCIVRFAPIGEPAHEAAGIDVAAELSVTARSVEREDPLSTKPYITCQELIDFIASYRDNELSPDQRVEFERHLSVCPSCVAYLKTYEQTIVADTSDWRRTRCRGRPRVARPGNPQRKGSQISVLSSVGGTVRASFRYSSTHGAFAGSSPLCSEPRPIQPLVGTLELRIRTDVERHGITSAANLSTAPVARLASSRQARSCMRLPAAPLAARRHIVVVDPERAS